MTDGTENVSREPRRHGVEPRHPPGDVVAAVVAEHASAFNLPAWRVVLIHRRAPEIVRCRWAIYYALKKLGYSGNGISIVFGTDPGTVERGIHRIVTGEIARSTVRWRSLGLKRHGGHVTFRRHV